MDEDITQPRTLAGEPLDPVHAVAAQLSEIAYLAEDECAAILAQHDFHDFGYVHSRLGTEGICVTRGGQAYVSFRGTKQGKDFLVDAMVAPWYRPLRHYGFGASWRSVEDQVRAWLAGHPDQPIHLSGHSLGGAVATVAGSELARGREIASITTFGGPRVFHFIGFSSPRAVLEDRCVRFVNSSDLVPRLLPALFGYRHLGKGRSAHDPAVASLSDMFSQAMDGLQGDGTGIEPSSKQVLRLLLKMAGLVIAPVIAILFGVLTATSLVRGGLRSGQNHARVRYVHNLGLEPLRHPAPRRETVQEAFRTRRPDRGSRDSTEWVAAALVAAVAAVVAYRTAGLVPALLAAVYVILAVPVLRAAVWFSTHHDPIGDVGRAISRWTATTPSTVGFTSLPGASGADDESAIESDRVAGPVAEGHDIDEPDIRDEFE